MKKGEKHIKVLSFTHAETTTIEERLNAVCDAIEAEGGRVIGFLPTTKIGYTPILLVYTIIYVTNASASVKTKRLKVYPFTYSDIDVIESKMEKEFVRFAENGIETALLPAATLGHSPQYILYHIVTTERASEECEGEGTE